MNNHRLSQSEGIRKDILCDKGFCWVVWEQVQTMDGPFSALDAFRKP